jgi:UDP:flavonoid glycosyltransferase YjiC (YdhE family)
MAMLVLATAGTLGDHLPFVALGQALARRGHAVRLAGSASLLDWAERAGLDARPLRPDLGAARARAHATHWDHWRDRRGGAGDRVDPRAYDLAGRHADLVAACAGADALLCASTIPWARLVHEGLRLPWLTVSATPYHFWKLAPGAPDPGRSARVRALLAPAAAREADPARVDFWGLLDDFAASLGLSGPSDPPHRAWLFAERVVLLASPHFSPPDLLEHGDLRLADFVFHEEPARAWRPDPALMRFLERGDPPVVLTFGSLPLADPAALVARHVEAARIAGVRLVVQGGWAGLAPGAADPAGVHGAGFVPQDWLFARAAAVIHHGGIGTTARALRQGLPMLVEPFGNDQFFNARQVLALGVGAALHPHRATPEDVARALRERVLAAPAAARARSLGGRIRAGRGAEAACDEVEAWLEVSARRARPARARGPRLVLIHEPMWGAPPVRAPADLPAGWELSTDRSRLHEAAAVVFHVPNLRRLPPRKPPGQIWVAWSMECEAHSPALRDPDLMGRFDLTMTHRLDSDVPVPYLDCLGSTERLLRALREPPRAGPREGLVAAFISSGHDRSGRQAYVSELMRHVEVHSYGAWRRNRTLPQDRGRETKLAVLARYAFTLAFENAIAEDYVTEKLFDPLAVGSVPVYLGAPNAARFAPGEGCYIDVADFPEPRALARRLLALRDDEAAYAELLAWKQRPLRSELLALAERFRESGWARLCRELERRRAAGGAPAETGRAPREDARRP